MPINYKFKSVYFLLGDTYRKYAQMSTLQQQISTSETKLSYRQMSSIVRPSTVNRSIRSSPHLTFAGRRSKSANNNYAKHTLLSVLVFV